MGPSQNTEKSWCHCVCSLLSFFPCIHEERSSRRKQRWRKLGNMCRAAPNPKSLTVILLQEICQMWNAVTNKKKQQAVRKTWWRHGRVQAPSLSPFTRSAKAQPDYPASADHLEECCHCFHNSEQVPKTTGAWEWPCGLASPVHLPDAGFLPSKQMKHPRSFKATRANHVEVGTLRIKGSLFPGDEISQHTTQQRWGQTPGHSL